MKSRDTDVMKPLIERRRSIGLASGALWLIVVSAVFVIWSLLSIGTLWARQVLVVAVVVIAVLVVISVLVIRAAVRLPAGVHQGRPEKRRIGRGFVWVVGMEVVAFGVVNSAAAAARRFELIPSLDLIVVGLHFFPLARIFRVPRYHLTGLLFCAIPVVTLLAIPKESVVGHVLAWYVVPSVGCGFVASLTAVAGLREAWQHVSESRAT